MFEVCEVCEVFEVMMSLRGASLLFATKQSHVSFEGCFAAKVQERRLAMTGYKLQIESFCGTALSHITNPKLETLK